MLNKTKPSACFLLPFSLGALPFLEPGHSPFYPEPYRNAKAKKRFLPQRSEVRQMKNWHCKVLGLLVE